MRYRVRTKQFCTLSKEQVWQGWLHSVAPDLHDDLIKHLQTSSGCRSNVLKMEVIQKQLDLRGLTDKMIGFLRREYPATIEEIQEAVDLKNDGPKSIVVGPGVVQDVFKIYNPNLLTFPQKIILQNPSPGHLYRDVLEFTRNKISVDYLIIDDMAFIEYFKSKYAIDARAISTSSRDIYRYRVNNGYPQTSRIIKSIKDNTGGTDELS